MSAQLQPASQRGSPGSNPIFLAAALFVVELLVFIIGLATGAAGWDAAVLALALITIFVGGVPILVDQARPPEKRHLLITLVVLVYMIFLVAPVFTQYFLLKGEWRPGMFALTRIHPSDIAHAQIVALAGLTLLLAGFYLPFGRAMVSALPPPTRDWSPRASLLVSLVTLGLGWTVYMAGQLGLIPPRAGSGALGTVANGWFLGISLLTLTWLRYRQRSALVGLWIIVPLSMAFNFFTGSKRLFLTPPFMVALGYLVFERRIRQSWAIGGLLLLILLYPTAQFYRDVVQQGYTLSAAEVLRNPGRALNQISAFTASMDLGEYFTSGLEATGSRLDALGVLTVIIRDTPDVVPYQGGWTIGYIALSYVPRILWPGKPATTVGDWVSQSYGSPYDLHTDVGPSWIGELYFNWGYLGVAVGMFLLGLLFRLLQEVFFRWNAPVPAMFAACVVLYSVARSVQSSLVGPINGTVYNLVPIAFAHLFVGLMGGFRSSGDTIATPPGASASTNTPEGFKPETSIVVR